MENQWYKINLSKKFNSLERKNDILWEKNFVWRKNDILSRRKRGLFFRERRPFLGENMSFFLEKNIHRRKKRTFFGD